MNSLKQIILGFALALAAAATVLGSLLASEAEGRLATDTDRLPGGSPPAGRTPSCPAPSGWIQHHLLPGETLDGLAARSNTPLDMIVQANCLVETSSAPGDLVYLPPESPAPAATPCGPPDGWSFVVVGSGDTWVTLTDRYGVPEEPLRQANCLGAGSLLEPGVRIYVPPAPTATRLPTATTARPPTPSRTETPTATP